MSRGCGWWRAGGRVLLCRFGAGQKCLAAKPLALSLSKGVYQYCETCFDKLSTNGF